MLNNEYPIFYRQWKDYFDFLEIYAILPEIAFGRIGFSSRLKSEAFASGDKTSFVLNLESKISSESSHIGKEVCFVVLGFGLRVTRRVGF